jgi:hypothetical protein
MLPGIDWGHFKGFNLNSLDCLSLYGLENQEIEFLLDLSLNSRSQEINLRFMNCYYLPSSTLFAHELLQRVRSMALEARELPSHIFSHKFNSTFEGDLSGGWAHFKYCNPLGIPLPQIKSWYLVGPKILLTTVDLSGAEILEFVDTGYHDHLDAELLPSQTKELILDGVHFIPAPSHHAAQLMTNLTKLELLDTTMTGPLQFYLCCPQLKTLRLQAVSFLSLDEDTISVARSDMPLSNALPLQSIPKLECLTLQSISCVDGKFAETLQYCPSLRYLTVELCPLEEFIPSLTDVLADSKSFPSLQRMTIEYGHASPDSEEALCEGFSSYCGSRRPAMIVHCLQSSSGEW